MKVQTQRAFSKYLMFLETETFRMAIPFTNIKCNLYQYHKNKEMLPKPTLPTGDRKVQRVKFVKFKTYNIKLNINTFP